MCTLCDSTGLFKMIVWVLTTSHTQCTWDSSIYVFFYLIEQHSKYLLHNLQALYMCTLCDSTNINLVIDNHHWHATNNLERTRLSYLVGWKRRTNALAPTKSRTLITGLFLCGFTYYLISAGKNMFRDIRHLRQKFCTMVSAFSPKMIEETRQNITYIPNARKS